MLVSTSELLDVALGGGQLCIVHRRHLDVTIDTEKKPDQREYRAYHPCICMESRVVFC